MVTNTLLTFSLLMFSSQLTDAVAWIITDIVLLYIGTFATTGK